MNIRNRAAAVPFQGTVLLLHGESPPAPVLQAANEVFRRQTALRLDRLDVSTGLAKPHLLAEVASAVAESNACVILLADDAARQAHQRWRPFYPADQPPVYGVSLPAAPAGAGAGTDLVLEDGVQLETYLDGGAWRQSPAFKRFGLRDGQAAEGAAAVTAGLARLAPSAVELLLGYSRARAVPYQFGDIALRIGDLVWACNGRAQIAVEPGLICAATLPDFLYGTRSALTNVEVTCVIGACYGRNVLGLRLFDVPRAARERMQGAIEDINDAWGRGQLDPGSLFHNSAALAIRILHAGGFALKPRLPHAPLDVFLKVLDEVDRGSRPSLVVHYRRVAASQSCYQEDSLPWRVTRPWSAEWLRRRLETRAGLRVETDATGRKLELDARAYHWENTIGRSRRVLLAPGSVNVSQAVRDAGMVDLSPHEPAFCALFEDITRKLLTVAGAPADRYQALPLGADPSAASEACVEAMSRVGRLVVISGGDAGQRLAELAALYRPDATQLVETPPATPLDPEMLRRALKPYRGQPLYVLVSHVESSTGWMEDLDLIAGICREVNAFLYVAAETPFGAHPIDLQRLGIVLVSGASAGALGGPAGVSFVIGDRQLLRRLNSIDARCRSLDLGAHYKRAVERSQMPGAPPVASLAALAAALSSVLAASPENAVIELSRRAAHLRRELMGAGIQFPFDHGHLSSVLTPALLPSGVDAAELCDALLARGFVLGRCPPPHEQDGLMIGHAGELTTSDLTGFVAALETELQLRAARPQAQEPAPAAKHDAPGLLRNPLPLKTAR